MRNNSIIQTCVSVLALAICAAPSWASITAATVANADNVNYNLTSVTVSRGAAGTFTYLPSQLTGVDLTNYAGYNVPFYSQVNSSIPAPGTRATLIEDNRLDTGVGSPVTINNPISWAISLTFLQPVVNSAGDDIVVFAFNETNTTRYYINNDDSQHVDASIAAVPHEDALISNMPVARFGYENPSTNSRTIHDMEELGSPTGYFIATALTKDVVATGLDLSDFGVPIGGTASSLQLMAASGRINPVMIVGLPAVPEPGTFALVSVAAAAVLMRRRRQGRAGT